MPVMLARRGKCRPGRRAGEGCLAYVQAAEVKCGLGTECRLGCWV